MGVKLSLGRHGYIVERLECEKLFWFPFSNLENIQNKIFCDGFQENMDSNL